ncbi:MAG: leucine-rich repeat domain-containing protein [Porcipelethomonas sp.]
MAIADYLQKLVELKNQLAENLRSMGVAAEDSEKLNTLVPKVLECETEQNVEFVEGTDFTGTSSATGLALAVSKITVPNTATLIGSYAFYTCSSLESITIPDSVTSIESYAFCGCSSLESITIPDSVKSIDINAFYYCTSLAHIYYTGTEEQWNAITKGTSWNYNMGTSVTGGTVIHYNYVPE